MSGNLKRAKQAPIKLRSLVQGFIRHNQMLHKRYKPGRALILNNF